MSNVIDYIYNNLLYKPFISLATIFINERYGVFILIGIIAILTIIQSKFSAKITEKFKYFPKVLNSIIILTVLFTAAVSYIKYKPNIDNFFKSSNTENHSTTPSNNKKNNSTPSQQTTPSNQSQKQLYYAVSCSTCWAEGCNHNGYSYGGYDAYYYNYYRTLCQSCSCNSYKAQSLWR